MVNLYISPTPIAEPSSSIDRDLFGGILINRNDFDEYVEDNEYLSLSTVRYPGGAFAEVGIVVNGQIQFSSNNITFMDLGGDRLGLAIDLTFPEFFNPELLALDDADDTANTYASLSEAMALAISNDAALSLILPTARYFLGVDLLNPVARDEMLALADHDIRLFLDRLASMMYNNGDYPNTIILELGNENYGTPIENALIAELFISAIEDVLSETGINFQIALQMNNGSSQFQSLMDRGYFSQFYDEVGNPLLPELQGFDFDPHQNYSYSERIVLIEQMMAHIIGDEVTNIDLLRHHYLSIDQSSFNTSGPVFEQRAIILEQWLDMIQAAGGDEGSVGYYVSAWTTDGNAPGLVPASMTAATNTLMLLTAFIDMGVDMAAVWGVNGSSRFWPDHSPDTVLTFRDEDGVTPSGEALRLISESIVGLSYVMTDQDRILDPNDPEDYLEFAFTSPERTVLFFTVGDLVEGSLNMTIDLSGFGYFASATIDNLGTEDGSSAGLAVVETQTVDIDNNEVQITFDQDNEVVRIIVENIALMGTDGRDLIDGQAADDVIFGGNGNDRLSGWAGDDLLYGGAGSDVIYGNNDSDSIFGGEANDQLWGADGFDFIDGGSGSDRLFGGSGDDTLVGGGGSDQLFGGEGDDLLEADARDISLEPSQSFLGEGSENWWPEVRGLIGDYVLSGGGDDDILVGGKGAGVFIFDDGHDVIRDFDAGIDTLALDLMLLGITEQDAVDAVQSARWVSGGILIEFSESESLHVFGDVNRAGLVESLTFI